MAQTTNTNVPEEYDYETQRQKYQAVNGGGVNLVDSGNPNVAVLNVNLTNGYDKGHNDEQDLKERMAFAAEVDMYARQQQQKKKSMDEFIKSGGGYTGGSPFAGSFGSGDLRDNKR